MGLGFKLLIQGILIGVVISAPVGAVATMCIQRTINKGIISGFALALGSALGDFIYAIVAGFGITIISDFLLENRVLLGIIGSIFLLFIGIRIFFSNPAKQIRNRGVVSKRTLINDFITSFFITISNPITIIGFGGLFATLGVIHDDTSKLEIWALLGGVFVGALSWWSFLILVINIFRKKIRLRSLMVMNRITGSIVFIFGVVLLVGILFFER